MIEFEVGRGDRGVLVPLPVSSAAFEQRGSRPTVDAAVRDDSCATTGPLREIPTYLGERTERLA